MTATNTGQLVGAAWIHRDGDRVELITTRCRSCDAQWFPPRDVCSRCASTDVHDQPSGDRGVVYASTVVRAGPATYRPPYVLSYVDIDDVRVLTHADTENALPPGTPVRLTIGEIGRDDTGSLTSYLVAALAEGDA